MLTFKTIEQTLPMAPEVKRINPNGVQAMETDVRYLTEFVESLDNSFMLTQTLDELQQTVELMKSGNSDEFFEAAVRNKKYPRVNAMNGPILLEKYAFLFLRFPTTSPCNISFTNGPCHVSDCQPR